MNMETERQRQKKRIQEYTPLQDRNMEDPFPINFSKLEKSKITKTKGKTS